MSKRQADEFSVAVELEEAEYAPGAEELGLLHAHFDTLFRLMLDELAAATEED